MNKIDKQELIKKALFHIIANQKDIDPDSIEMKSSLIEDIELFDNDFLDLQFDIEEEFHIYDGFDGNIETVNDLFEAIKNAIDYDDEEIFSDIEKKEYRPLEFKDPCSKESMVEKTVLSLVASQKKIDRRNVKKDDSIYDDLKFSDKDIFDLGFNIQEIFCVYVEFDCDIMIVSQLIERVNNYINYDDEKIFENVENYIDNLPADREDYNSSHISPRVFCLYILDTSIEVNNVSDLKKFCIALEKPDYVFISTEDEIMDELLNFNPDYKSNDKFYCLVSGNRIYKI